jgi:hypothetical protein
VRTHGGLSHVWELNTFSYFFASRDYTQMLCDHSRH